MEILNLEQFHLKLQEVGRNNVLISDKVKVKIEKNIGLSIEEVLDKLYDFNSHVIAAKYVGGDYRIICELSSKFHLVIILFINDNIRIATAIKSNKNVKKLLKKSKIIYTIVKKTQTDTSFNA